MAKSTGFSDEIKALGTVLEALNDLDEEKRAFVYKMAGERLDIATTVQKKSGAPASTAESDDDDDDDDSADDDVSPKAFMRDKKARTDVERVACLAFYLTHHRSTATFKTKEVTALNTEAALPKLGNASQAMKNATAQNHYLAAAGKGTKQITALGEDVVKALPDREKVNTVLANSQKPKRRRKRVAKKKTAGSTTRKTSRKR